MHRNASLPLFLAISVALGLGALSGCATVEEGKEPVTASVNNGKIPITTVSDEAKKELVKDATSPSGYSFRTPFNISIKQFLSIQTSRWQK